MATTIIQRIVGGIPDNRIQLSNSQFGRAITIPATWSKVRVGIHFDMTDSGGSLTGNPKFYMGLGHGTTNMIGSATCDHFVGLKSNGATWTRFAAYYNQGTASIIGMKKVGVAETSAGGLNSGPMTIGHDAGGVGTDRTYLNLTITKGSPNYGLNLTYNTGGGAPDSTSDYFQGIVCVQPEQATAAYTVAGIINLAVDEAVDGILNTVQIYWDHTDSKIEICDLAVAIVA